MIQSNWKIGSVTGSQAVSVRMPGNRSTKVSDHAFKRVVHHVPAYPFEDLSHWGAACSMAA